MCVLSRVRLSHFSRLPRVQQPGSLLTRSTPRSQRMVGRPYSTIPQELVPKSKGLMFGAVALTLYVGWQWQKSQEAAREEDLNRSRDKLLDLLAARKGTVVDHAGKPVDVRAALQGKTIGLYFSALWCPPCRQFSPILQGFYRMANAKEKQMEIIFVSCDINEEQHAYYEKHVHDLWLHIPYKEQELHKALKKMYHCWAGPKDGEELGSDDHKFGIPTLVLYNPDGSIIDDRGTEVVRRWHMNAVQAAQAKMREDMEHEEAKQKK